MSTILKALRRIEAEKAADAPRELREEVAAPAFAASPPRSRLWIPGAFVALAVAGGTAWWMLPWEGAELAAGSPTPPPGAPATVAVETELALTPAPVVPAPPLRPAPIRDPADLAPAEGLPDQAFSSPVEVVDRPPAKPRIPMEEPAAPTTRAPRRSEEPEPVVVETAAAPPIPVETVTKVTAPAPPAKRSEATPPQPAARAEPVEDSSPSVRVEKTRWHPKPHRRDAMVAVDGAAAQRVHEGDVVGRLVVTEIEPSGVLFERDGQKLRRRIGESSP